MGIIFDRETTSLSSSSITKCLWEGIGSDDPQALLVGAFYASISLLAEITSSF